MPNDTTDNLKKYLLGSSKDAEQERIEERLLTDDQFFEEFLAAEEDLIQDYVDGDLKETEQKQFETHFLISEERQKKLKFARTLRKNIDARSAEKIAKAAKNETKEKTKTKSDSSLNFFQKLFASPLPAFAGLLVILVLGSFLIWNFYSNSNDTEIALASLNKAYKTERPLESRITGLDYAPLKNTRGGDDSKIDTIALDRAKHLSQKVADENPTAENLHSVGRFYLTQKEFDKAIEQLEKAEKLDSNNAQIQNDLGVAYLEKAKLADEGAESLELGGKALENFDKSIEINSNLAEVRFNKAVNLQLINLPRQAAKAWQDYLEIDSTSKWADEARKNLDSLRSQNSIEPSAEQLEQEFLKAFSLKEDEKMWEIVSGNRELIKEKYLPQKLAMSFIESPTDEKNRYLEALEYLGKLEKKRIRDSFAYDLSEYYKNISNKRLKLLVNAQNSIRKGYKYCLEDKFSQALVEFNLARDFFLQAENYIEAETISKYFIAYCLYNMDRRKESYELFEQIDKFCQKKKYEWFQIMNNNWLMGNQISLGYRASAETRGDYEKDLVKALDIKDLYMTQKLLLSLVLKNHFVRQEKKTLDYLSQLLKFSNRPDVSERQRFRNFNKAIEILATKKFKGIAKAIVLESVELAEPMEDPLFAIGSQINAGVVHTQTEDFGIAKEWLDKARQNSEKLQEPIQKNTELAKIFLKSGDLERSRSNYDRASEFYDKSLDLLTKLNTPILLYETKKARLISHQKAGNDEEVEKDIGSTLQLAEKHRNEISKEQERNSFFDNEQDIFDVAIEHNIRKKQDEKAFDYAESSSSRSLLDWLHKGVKVSVNEQDGEINFDKSTEPLKVKDIRRKMPSNVQILQYTILENKVLLWLISKENFQLVSSEINSDVLEEKVGNYVSLIESENAGAKTQIKEQAEELYDILIKPIIPYLDTNKEICLVPNKILFYLPFSSLISQSGRYFLEDFNFFYSPSSNIFIVSTDIAKNKANIENEKILSIGNPSFDSEVFPDLPNLPDASSEANDIAKNYKTAKVLVGREATKQNFQTFYKDYEVLHFAGHYVIQTDSPLLSKLVMAKNSLDKKQNYLTNAELIGEKLEKTKLVVLSACRTGVEKYYKGEGMVGLSRTFLLSGVPLVIASQWQVDSNATDELMRNFHHYRQTEKLSSSRALRKAQIDMLKSKDSKFQSPYFWASFATFGGYAEY